MYVCNATGYEDQKYEKPANKLWTDGAQQIVRKRFFNLKYKTYLVNSPNADIKKVICYQLLCWNSVRLNSTFIVAIFPTGWMIYPFGEALYLFCVEKKFAWNCILLKSMLKICHKIILYFTAFRSVPMKVDPTLTK